MDSGWITQDRSGEKVMSISHRRTDIHQQLRNMRKDDSKHALVHYINEKSFISRKMARATMKCKAVGSDFKSHFEFSLTLVMQA